MPDLGSFSFAAAGGIAGELFACTPGSANVKVSRVSDSAAVELQCQRQVSMGDAAVAPCSSAAPSAPRGVKRTAGARSLAEHVREWAERKVAAGVPKPQCELPFLTGAPRAVDCRTCKRIVHLGEELQCSDTKCHAIYHRNCAGEVARNSGGKQFRCRQHGRVCFVCKRDRPNWRCRVCEIAIHVKCAPWPKDLKSQHGRAVCWRHDSDWRLKNELADLTADAEEAISRLPLPYTDEEFELKSISNGIAEIESVPSPYVHIRRNVYLVKRKRDGAADTGCTRCGPDSTCKDDCECRGLSISCSKACRCSNMCKNKPFRKEKKIKIVKTEQCGWGVISLEAMEKGDFVIEYIGEVIDDVMCEQRFWDMKSRGDSNFYMCEISKDCTIDATFKGNCSRFLNHSCEPNCNMEKWQVDGETRVGIFAARSIEVGEPLTYDYRFVHFGDKVKCYCGSVNCQGSLGKAVNPVMEPHLPLPEESIVAETAIPNEATPAPENTTDRRQPLIPVLPWNSCIDLPFKLRSSDRIDHIRWKGKRKRSFHVQP